MIPSMWASMAAWFTPPVLFCLTNLIVGTILIASKSNDDTKHHDNVHRNSYSPITRVSSFLEQARSVNLSSYTTTTTTTTATAVAESQHQIPPKSQTAKYSSSSRLAQSIYLSSSQVPPPEYSNVDKVSQSESVQKLVRAPSLLERVMSIKFPSVYTDNTLQTESTESEQISNSPGQFVRAPSFLDRVKSFRISSAFTSGAPSTQPENVVTNTHRAAPDHHVIKSKSEKRTSAKKTTVEMKKSRSEMRIASEDDDEDVDLRRPATARARVHAIDEEVDAKADDFITRFKQQLKLQRLESLVRYRDMMNRGKYH